MIKCKIKIEVLKSIILTVNGFTIDPSDSISILRDNDIVDVILKNKRINNDNDIRSHNIETNGHTCITIKSPKATTNNDTNKQMTLSSPNTNATTTAVISNTDSTQVWHFLKRQQEDTLLQQQKTTKKFTNSNSNKKQKTINKDDNNKSYQYYMLDNTNANANSTNTTKVEDNDDSIDDDNDNDELFSIDDILANVINEKRRSLEGNNQLDNSYDTYT